MSWIGEQGMSGPTSMTDFEIRDGSWTDKHVELENLCISVLNFLHNNPEIAERVEITKKTIKSSL